MHDQTQHSRLTLLGNDAEVHAWFASDQKSVSFNPVSSAPPVETDLFLSIRGTPNGNSVHPNIATTSGASCTLQRPVAATDVVWFGCSSQDCYESAAEYFNNHPPGEGGHHSIAVQDPG